MIPLTIPSGFITGIKLVHSFEVTKNGLMELILDFDAMNSIVKTGNGKLILKPTIKIIEALNYAEVSGRIGDDSGELGGVRVSAQTYDAENDVIAEQAATYTDTDDLGFYRLPLEPNQSYNIIAFSEDYAPECVYISAENGNDYIQDFDLAPSDNKEVTLEIGFQDGNPNSFPDISVSFIYLDADCGDGASTNEIQVASVVAVYSLNTSTYDYNIVTLPYGNYKLKIRLTEV